MTTNDETEQTVEEVQTEVETLEEATPEEKDTTDYKAKYEETMGRLKRAQTKLDKKKIDEKVEQEVKKKTGELDETALDYLDLKGITEDEDIQLIENIAKKTGQTVRQVLKDEYVVSKLDANKKARDVAKAVPGSTKRSGNSTENDVEFLKAKYEQSGFSPDALPEDFTLRSAVINAIQSSQNKNKPAWH